MVPYCNLPSPEGLSADEVDLWSQAWMPVCECYTTMAPTSGPTTAWPTWTPSAEPTKSPIGTPTSDPSSPPTESPSSPPTTQSPTTQNPTAGPSASPSSSPSKEPTSSPSSSPTKQPSDSPSLGPTDSPTPEPSAAPTAVLEPVAASPESPICPDAYDPSHAPTYTEGSQVEVNAVVYQCRPYPYAYYCTQLEFRPDPDHAEDTLWMDAWAPVGPCQRASVTGSPSAPQSSSSPTSGPTRSPTGSPLAQPSKPTHGPTHAPSATIELTQGSPSSSSPTSGPTESPTGSPSAGPTVTEGLSVNPATLEVPKKRFTEWSSLGNADRGYATDYLEYDEYSWNHPGVKEIETWSYDDLYPEEVEGLGLLGITGSMWDCHVNHYGGYYWADLVQSNLDQYFVGLGWDESSWDDDGPEPDTSYLSWGQLTMEQQAAASQVCYSAELWDEVPLDDWDPAIEPTAPSDPIVSIGASINPATLAIPERRFVEWLALNDTELEYAGVYLGYDISTWNNPGQAEVEAYRYQSLYENEVRGAVGLGISEAMWDCHVNHYADYYWNDLVESGLDQHFTKLGWSMEAWDNDGPEPETEDEYWDGLTSEQQIAASQICYSSQLWDGTPLPEWQANDLLVTPPTTTTPTPMQYCPPTYDHAKTDYVAGHLVEINSLVFECSEELVRYCNIPTWDESLLAEDENAKEHWDTAWVAKGECYRTQSPTAGPSASPTGSPSTETTTAGPSAGPTRTPTPEPSSSPTAKPSQSPSVHLRTNLSPTRSPSKSPSNAPLDSPTTLSPSQSPTAHPTTRSPTRRPNKSPSNAPSDSPTTLSPSPSPTAHPTTLSPTRSPSASPFATPTTDSPTTLSPTQSPTAHPTTRSPTKSPSASPFATPTTDAPTTSPSESPTPGPSSTQPSSSPAVQIANIIPNTETASDNINQSYGLSANPAVLDVPETRFLTWSSLSDSDVQYASNNLGYDQYTWNRPGEADIESWSYHDLYEVEVAGLRGLNITEEAYDCWVNHYAGYWWLDIVHYGYAEYLDVLGWTAGNWDGDEALPSSENLVWDQLSPREQAAAKQLCYTRELWDEVPLPYW